MLYIARVCMQCRPEWNDHDIKSMDWGAPILGKKAKSKASGGAAAAAAGRPTSSMKFTSCVRPERLDPMWQQAHSANIRIATQNQDTSVAEHIKAIVSELSALPLFVKPWDVRLSFVSVCLPCIQRII